MTLASGTRVGSYEVVTAIGAGGMGEVYRARDAKLNRDVALKVLPETFAGDPDRLARFTREAQVLASLNHPNIAQIYGVEETPAGVRALVMELVEGPTLAEMIAAAGPGGMPRSDALAIAQQIADALEDAHDKGVIHRDLKPANVKVRPDGSVKLLDFGLAKALVGEGSGTSSEAANSPTLTARATAMGTIIGTAAYMAPEQARGKTIDRRVDVWAFGAVLFEMLSGRRAFDGDDISITLANVLKEEPPWTALPRDLSAPLRRLLRRCLEKDPKKRLRSIGDARIELDETGEPQAAPAGSSSAPRPVRRWPVGVGAAVAGGLIVALGMTLWPGASAPSAVRRLSIMPAAGSELYNDSRESVISPDGRAVAFITGAYERYEATQLWVRPLGAAEARPIAGTTGAHLPFWSPDSRRIAFFAGGKLNIVGADGGRVEALCDAPDPRGGTWGSKDVIVFAPNSGGALQRVPTGGGTPSTATTLDAGAKETGHRFPFFLPDGVHFLYAALPAQDGLFPIFIGALDRPDRTLLMKSESTPVYTEPGYLVFSRKGAIAIQRFDAVTLRLSGEAVTLEDAPGGIGNQYSSGSAATVTAGAMVYLNDPFVDTRLAWFDRQGRELGDIGAPPARYGEIRLSPDNKKLAVVRSSSTREGTLWTIDLATRGATKIADKKGLNYQVAWSPSGDRLVYCSDGSGTETLYVRDAAAAMPERLLFQSPVLFKKPRDWSPDGQTILFNQRTPDTQNDLATVPVAGAADATPWVHDPGNEDLSRFSPDGHWIAYVSDESGTPDVYVRSFPKPDRKFRVTTDGGVNLAWKRDGSALLVVGGDGRQLKIVDVRLGPEQVSIGAAKVVGALPPGTVAWDASSDLERLIVSRPATGSEGLSLTVVTDWLSAIAKK